jgi:hypothetical protein
MKDISLKSLLKAIGLKDQEKSEQQEKNIDKKQKN